MSPYDHDDAPSEYDGGQEDARADPSDGNGRRRLEEGVGKEEYQRNDRVRIVFGVHTKLGLHSADTWLATTFIRRSERRPRACLPSHGGRTEIGAVEETDHVHASQGNDEPEIDSTVDLLLLFGGDGCDSRVRLVGVLLLELDLLHITRLLHIMRGIMVRHDGCWPCRRGSVSLSRQLSR